MPNNYSRQTYDRHPDKIERNHLCPLCGAYVLPFLGVLGTEHKGHCPKCGTVTYVSMPETVTHEFTSFIRAELEQEKHKALKIVLDVTTPKLPPAKNNTLQSFAEKRERQFNQFYYGNKDGLPYFPHQTQEAQDK